MTATLRPSLYREWICRHLRAAATGGDPRLVYGEAGAKPVGIDEVFPGDRNVFGQAIYCGKWAPTTGTNVREMKAGTKRYEHLYDLVVHIDIASGLDPGAAEDRAFELFDVLHEIVAANVVPYDATGTTALAYSAVLGNVESDTGWVDKVGACQLTARIQFHIDT